MNQFFVEQSAIRDNSIIITGDDVKHINNVLRLRVGEEIQVVGLHNQLTYFCEIRELDKNHVECLITDVQSESTELPVYITLYQGLPKGDKLEMVIQKAVEMGASQIVPVSMKRSVMKIDPKKAENKQNRWQAIADSAASQSKRTVLPEVSGVMTYGQAVQQAKEESDVILLPYELASGMNGSRAVMEAIRDKVISQADTKLKIAIFIGPEGGFDDSEIDMAKDAGAQVITLGRRILRTETAPIAILAWLTYMLDS